MHHLSEKLLFCMIYVYGYISVCAPSVWCQKYEDMDRLQTDVLRATSYNRDVRPVQDQSHVVMVMLWRHLATS